MDTGYKFDINDFEVTYISLLEEGFIPTEEEE